MSGAGFSIDGYGNLVTIFRDMPEDGYRKPLMTAFKKAADPVKRAMIANLPSYLKPQKAAIKIKPGKGKSLTLAVGVFGRQGLYVNRRGQKWDPYMLLYWHNYGTLSKRAPEHHFQKARRKPSLNWKGGIMGQLFIDRAWMGSQNEALKIFETEFEKEHQKFLEARALK